MLEKVKVVPFRVGCIPRERNGHLYCYRSGREMEYLMGFRAFPFGEHVFHRVKIALFLISLFNRIGFLLIRSTAFQSMVSSLRGVNRLIINA